MATTLPSSSWRTRTVVHHMRKPLHRRPAVCAFRRRDFDRFASPMASGEAWRDAWRTANDGFEQLVFEAKKTAERIDRRYSVSRRLSSVVQSASIRVREIDREFEIGTRWRTFTMDFNRNWPRYRKQLSDFLETPLGKSFATIFFLWFALSGWLFQFLIFATWLLPVAAPLLIGTVANNLVIKVSQGVNENREWNTKNASALLDIKISCEAEASDKIKEMKSAKEAWDALADMHKPPSFSQEIAQRQEDVSEEIEIVQHHEDSREIEIVQNQEDDDSHQIVIEEP